jgi:alpha-L-fucosidase
MKQETAWAVAAGMIFCVVSVFAEDNLAKRQEEFLRWKFGMFLHFNIATFNNAEWSGGYEDPGTFAPDKLDCGQWADAAKAAGMNYAVL